MVEKHLCEILNVVGERLQAMKDDIMFKDVLISELREKLKAYESE